MVMKAALAGACSNYRRPLKSAGWLRPPVAVGDGVDVVVEVKVMFTVYGVEDRHLRRDLR
ncbi:MAG: hypothetical protein U0528_05725 [Anaerolineae bacterium]